VVSFDQFPCLRYNAPGTLYIGIPQSALGEHKLDNKSLVLLEFPKVREILAGFTSFSASRELALSLLPTTDPVEISLRLEQAAEARQLLYSGTPFSLGGAIDVRQAVFEASLDKTLEPGILLDINTTLVSGRNARTALGRLSKELPRLWDIAQQITAFPDLETDISQCISERGEVLDSASTALADLRRKIKEVHEQLLAKLDAITKSPRNRTLLEEPFITIRDGRYVIPVKIEQKRQLKGIVHDVSNTGASVFMEPWATVELGNTWRELQVEESREVQRILLGLSRKIGAQREAISQNIELLAQLDLTLAKARYADKHKAAVAKLMPLEASDKADGASQNRILLKLVSARHPLLKGEVVPLSVEIGKDFSILVITGPNTGGKTVALKTIGLLTLMTQAGMPIPASGDSLIPVFDSVFADIGDEQSIEQSLSTFSWHMGNTVRILQGATGKSLVLLDEIGSSTDPNEGSALARAILLHLLSRGIMTVATTHHRDLTIFAHATPGLQNASLDFDSATLSPTFRLRVGLPGGSNAMAIASRLGLSADIVATAREMLSPGTQKMEALLVDIARERDQATAQRQALDVARVEAENLRDKLARESQELESQKRRILVETRENVEAEAAELQRQLRQASSELKKTLTRQRLEDTRKALEAVREQLRSTLWKPQPVEAEGVEQVEPAKELAINDRVWLPEMQLWGTVLSKPNDRGEMEIQVGNVKLRLGIEHIERRETTSAGTTTPLQITIVRPHITPSMELDLRGRRADEVPPELERYLNDVSLAKLPQVRIIHGFGTGVVRQIVRSILSQHPLVKSFRPADAAHGGDGATVVEL